MDKNLPSTYIKYWWYWKRLNTQNLLDTLLIISASIQIANKVLKEITKKR